MCRGELRRSGRLLLLPQSRSAPAVEAYAGAGTVQARRLGQLAQDGWTTEEMWAGATVVLGAIMVYFVPNQSSEEDREMAEGDL